MARFQRKNYLNRIIWTIATLFALAFIALLFMPISMGGDFKRSSQEKIALNFAATVAQAAGSFYSYHQATPIADPYKINEGIIFFDKNNRIVIPEGYVCTITDSVIVVTHGDNIKEEVRWRY